MNATDRTEREGGFAQLSDDERDGRWSRMREEMEKRGSDCLLVYGNAGRWSEMHGNLRYVSGYADVLSGAAYAIFPRNGDGTLLTQMGVKRSARAMSWFDDIRGGASKRVSEVLKERLSDLGLERGTIGLVGVSCYENVTYGMPWEARRAIEQDLPTVTVVEATDIFYDLRAIKSDEEIACLEKSAALVDVGYRALLELAKPGATEREVHIGVTYAMDLAGAEPPSFHLLESGPMPAEKMQAGDPLPADRTLRLGDVICNETSPKYLGYQAQGLQCVVLGEPREEMKELAKYAAEIFHGCADRIRPGNSFAAVKASADAVVERARKSLGGLADGLRPDCDAAGLGCPDADPPFDEIVPNQAFMLEIGAGGRPYNPSMHLYGGHCLVTTADGIRHLTDVPVEDRLFIVNG